MLPLLRMSSIRPLALTLVVFEIVGLILTDGREQLFDEPGPVLQNDVWTGTAQGQWIRIPTSEVQEVVISEEKTNVLSIVAIVAFIGLGVAAIAIASEQR